LANLYRVISTWPIRCSTAKCSLSASENFKNQFKKSADVRAKFIASKWKFKPLEVKKNQRKMSFEQVLSKYFLLKQNVMGVNVLV